MTLVVSAFGSCAVGFFGLRGRLLVFRIVRGLARGFLRGALANPDAAIADSGWKDFQIYFGETVGDFAAANVETRIVPGALYLAVDEASF